MPAIAPPLKQTVQHLAAELAAGRTSSRALVEAALARIADPHGEGSRTFIKVYADTARAAADAQDQLRGAGYVASPLAGLPISIKDLFDVAGEVTLAASRALDDQSPAAADSPVVARLRAAGAVLIGRTNMTEFAFSGVGINPHFGTPGNPHDRSRIPGGSSSGAAVSVADGQAVVAIGTDTGGSVRIPAALCGLAGFKPTQKRISRDRAIPLSTTLDSVGPLANSLACCAITDAVLAGEAPSPPQPAPVAGMRIGVPQSLVLDDLAPEVAAAFASACTRLSQAGAQVVDLKLNELNELPAINAGGGFSAIEAYTWHQSLLARRGADYDRRVRIRIERAASMTAVEYIRLIAARADFIARVDARTAAFDALLLPTVAITAPPIAAFTPEDDYWRLNGLILRNSSVINFLDRCAATIPIRQTGALPIGLMIVGEHNMDHKLLAVACGIEAALATGE
ncbi:MAG TPA: amidase [Stellaceae bacterium]|jgi:aspartyl-tRNA(Asn)/glutamyl-tRNA(Gln) amidotransferase subunit A|nr:amidase [Stellaceae bacterium]